jgi:hypothetical protein
VTRRLPWALVPLLLATPALAGPGAPSAGAVLRRPTTLEAALEAVAHSEERLSELVRTAKEDPRVLKIARYMALTTETFGTSPRVRVTDLVSWMADASAPLVVREKARDALKSATHRSADPDLQISEGRSSKRISFCLKHLVPLLVTPDPPNPPGGSNETTRAFAADVLDSYWHSNDPDIQRYNPRPGNEKTWAAAVAAYKRYLAAR